MNADIDIVSIIMPKISGWQMTAINFAKSRFLVAASEYGMNDKESAELMNIADGITIEIFQEGNSVGMNINYGQSPYLDIIQNGMPAPLTGGDGGTAHNPDGSTYQSNVPVILQGQPIESFAKQGEDVMGEIGTMISDLFRQEIIACVDESHAELGEALKIYLVPQLGLGGT